MVHMCMRQQHVTDGESEVRGNCKPSLRIFVTGIDDGSVLLDKELYKDRRNDAAFMARLRQQLEPDPQAFDPIPTPVEDDWLWDHNTKDQSFAQFARKNGWRCARPGGKIYLLPIGGKSLETGPPFDALQGMVAAFFCMPCVMLAPVRIPRTPHLDLYVPTATGHSRRSVTVHRTWNLPSPGQNESAA